MKVDGYGIQVEWDGATLRARGKSKQRHKMLAGDLAQEGDVLIPKDSIARAYLKEPSVVMSGKLGIRTVDGRTFDLRFLKKHTGEFADLARELGAEV